jgi:hypothetical protein
MPGKWDSDKDKADKRKDAEHMVRSCHGLEGEDDCV